MRHSKTLRVGKPALSARKFFKLFTEHYNVAIDILIMIVVIVFRLLRHNLFCSTDLDFQNFESSIVVD